MELKLFFSEEEIISFLLKNEYTIENIDTRLNHNSYHNNIETINTKVKIALSKNTDIEKDFLLKDKYSIKSKYGIEQVFKNLLKEKLLNL